MPQLVRLYIQNVFAGFGLSVVFVGGLLALNVGNLWHLITTSSVGWIAVAMLVVFNGLVFASVQFAMTVMRMAEDGTPPSGGRRAPIATRIPVRVKAEAEGSKPRQIRR